MFYNTGLIKTIIAVKKVDGKSVGRSIRYAICGNTRTGGQAESITKTTLSALSSENNIKTF